MTGERNGPLLPWQEKCAENGMGSHPGKGFCRCAHDTEKKPPSGSREAWLSVRGPDLGVSPGSWVGFLSHTENEQRNSGVIRP